MTMNKIYYNVFFNFNDNKLVQHFTQREIRRAAMKLLKKKAALNF